jgi:hypothetical protein
MSWLWPWLMLRDREIATGELASDPRNFPLPRIRSFGMSAHGNGLPVSGRQAIATGRDASPCKAEQIADCRGDPKDNDQQDDLFRRQRAT